MSSSLLILLLPWKLIGKALVVFGKTKGQFWNLLPCMFDIDLILLTPEVLPYLPQIVEKDYIEKLGDAMILFKSSKKHVLPVMPEILANLDIMMPTLDVLKPHFEKIAPYTKVLMPHMETLARNIQNFAPYVDEFLPFMEIEGWDSMMEHLDELSPWISSLAPHMSILQKHFANFTPLVPIMAKHIDSFGPILDKVLPHTEKLIHFISLLPYLEKTGVFSSPVLVRGFANSLSVIPMKLRIEDLDPEMAYELPERNEIVFKVEEFKDMVSNNKIVKLFKVEMVSSKGCAWMRYSVLHSMNRRLRASVDQVARDIGSTEFINLRMLYPRFPSRSMNDISERMQDLELFFNSLISIENGLIMKLPEFKNFVCMLTISTLIR